jgi:hypothetical protein
MKAVIVSGAVIAVESVQISLGIVRISGQPQWSMGIGLISYISN